jgi:biotin synthase-related radical SAM superfamily protein
MEKIFNNNQSQINTTLEEEVEKIIEEPWMRPIRAEEASYLSINEFWDILPPDTKPSNYFNDKSYTNKNYINKKNKWYNISTEEDWQLRIEFD